MAKCYEVKIIATHDFDKVVYDQLFLRLSEAKKAAALQLMVAQSGDEPEWADSWEISLKARELHK